MIVLYSGSFDPIHLGHIALARYVANLPDCEKVIVMPSRRNPLKPDRPLFSDEFRLELARCATVDIEGVEVSSLEMEMPLPSYTINTLKALQKLYPGSELRLLIGSDNWESFNLWKNYEEILSDFGLLIYPRPGSEISVPKLSQNITYLAHAPQLPISSTMVRRQLKLRQNVDALTGKAVAHMLRGNCQNP